VRKRADRPVADAFGRLSLAWAGTVTGTRQARRTHIREMSEAEGRAGGIMRKMIVSNYVTLDGFLSGLDDETDWIRSNEAIDRYTRELTGSVDTIVFGRVTYELLARYWPSSASAKEDAAIRDFMNETEKVVFSKTLEQAAWNNTKIISKFGTETVMELKDRPGKDIVIYGSGSLIGELAGLGLVDDYRFFVNPVVLGRGKPMFGDNTRSYDFELIETRAFANGVVMLRYAPA
jgi:dihydrofolate reductase